LSIASFEEIPEWARAHSLFLGHLFTAKGFATAGRENHQAKMARDHERIGRIRDAAARVAASYGLEIFDVQLRRESIGNVLRVVIDRPDQGRVETPEDAVGIEDCQRVSHDLSALLDVEEEELGEAALAQEYTLEVSSPGLDRPLRHEADYRRFQGRLAKVVTNQPLNGQSAFSGHILRVEDGAVLLGEGRRMHRVPLSQIKRANLAVEF
jgi:ribosome maturation factor RimP